ncbi:GMC oxidoreductase [Lentzea nigeriaca]|uniref:GMC oxidoreductase n=1 Tax=Lentzea nigeriaca TaxID=1128665 RepID=UPI00195B43E4|nr:GMC family oxidoreductase [Lentzea nigeriaca]MBM7858415.1 cholesterol oxidase [Lentzea nigeriaca]
MTGPRERTRVEHVNTVVVGSGFGGSVAAYRLAEAGQSVVLLERGRPYPPGSFPRTPAQMGKAFWDPGAGLHGLFDVWRFGGFDSVVSSGLGGGSLIYANVLLRKDEKWFVREDPLPGGGYEHWPVTRADLDPHYDAVEKMLGATRYPIDAAPYRSTHKTHAMIQFAERNGLDWQLPPLAVSFAPAQGAEPGMGLPIAEPAYGNIHGVPRRTCRLVGECDIGCNDGAKNSLDHTYISAAAHHGADVRTGCEVRGIAPLPEGGYTVAFVRHDFDGDGAPAPARSLPVHRITCDRLVLGAGAYGTTFLLLRNRAALTGLSPTLGSRFSGNGDLLTFVVPEPGKVSAPLDASFGPVITTAVRVDDAPDGAGRGFYLQDGGYPGFTDWLLQSTDLTGSVFRFGEFVTRWALNVLSRSPQSNVSKEVSRLIGSGALSAGSLPLLGMGRDVPDGRMRLREGMLDIRWSTRTSKEYFRRVRDTMRELSDSLGAGFLDNPIWFFRRVVTVHPLGGAPMGRGDGEGVCDSHGEVFNHPGLFVADGAAMPGPVGANPSLTIAAHADRMAEHILRQPKRRRPAPRRQAQRRQPVPARRSVVIRTPAKAGRSTSLAFTEEMKGFFDFGAADPRTGLDSGKAKDQALMFRLTIATDDVDSFIRVPSHLAEATGYVESDVLGGRLPVQAGWFNLFTAGAAADSRSMRYRLHFADGVGNPLTLSGFKDIRHGSPLRIWPDTSTLYYRVLTGHVDEKNEADAPVVGAGVLRILEADFLRQLTTFRTNGPMALPALTEFGQFFLGQLWSVYGPQFRANALQVATG